MMVLSDRILRLVFIYIIIFQLATLRNPFSFTGADKPNVLDSGPYTTPRVQVKSWPTPQLTVYDPLSFRFVFRSPYFPLLVITLHEPPVLVAVGTKSDSPPLTVHSFQIHNRPAQNFRLLLPFSNPHEFSLINQ